MKFPKLNQGEFALLFSELKTGHVLTKDCANIFHTNSDESPYLIITSLSDARDKALNIINSNPLVEVSIYDNKGKFLEIHRKL